MDKLKEELAKKKRLLENKNLIGKNKKYFKRSDFNKSDESNDINCLKNEQGDAKNNKNDEEIIKKEVIFRRKEVIKRLRDRNEPILLFGEDERDAFLRLKHLELINPDHTKGQVNDFQQAMERVDKEYLNEMLKSDNQNDQLREKMHDVQLSGIDTTFEDVQKMAKNLGKKKDNNEEDSKIICTFLKFILGLWGEILNSRSYDVKASTIGKIASATYTQTQNYLKPLFRQLMKNKVAEDIIRHLVLIVKYMLERNYVKANDAYLQMAIGNAPWPIGVTMVGIHARTGREKIFSQNIAHVLNDETQRKYIQGIKRLITQCQKYFPTDPSRCVEYNAIDN